MLIGDASTEFLSGYFSTNDRKKKTRVAYSSDLAQFRSFVGEELNLSAVDAQVIEGWAAALRQGGFSPASMRRKMVALRVFCGYWVRRGVLPESPFWRVRLSFGRTVQLPRTLTEAEMAALLRQARQSNSTVCHTNSEPEASADTSLGVSSCSYRCLRNSALVELLFATGIRVGEASSLDITDFLVDEATFTVKGKGGRDRLAFVVDAEAIRIQRVHLDARKRIASNSTALFVNSSGGRLSTQGIANVLSQFRKSAGIERHVTPHMLRHTVATLLLRNGVDIRVVQEFLGHSSIATTQRYTHVSKEHLIGALRRSHPSLDLGQAVRG